MLLRQTRSASILCFPIRLTGKRHIEVRVTRSTVAKSLWRSRTPQWALWPGFVNWLGSADIGSQAC